MLQKVVDVLQKMESFCMTKKNLSGQGARPEAVIIKPMEGVG